MGLYTPPVSVPVCIQSVSLNTIWAYTHLQCLFQSVSLNTIPAYTHLQCLFQSVSLNTIRAYTHLQCLFQSVSLNTIRAYTHLQCLFQSVSLVHLDEVVHFMLLMDTHQRDVQLHDPRLNVHQFVRVHRTAHRVPGTANTIKGKESYSTF